MKALPFVISFSSLLFLSFACVLIFGLAGYRKKKERGYSFLSEFPFELNENQNGLSQISRVAVFASGLSFALAETSLLWDNDFYPYITLGIVITVLGIAKAACYILLYKVPAYHFKPHILVSVLHMALTGLLCAFEGIFFLNLRAVSEVPALVLMGCEFAFALLLCVLAVNPKMSSWTKMETIGNEDGSIEVVRPKPFVLAFSEWLAIFADLAGTLVFVLGIALFELN